MGEMRRHTNISTQEQQNKYVRRSMPVTFPLEEHEIPTHSHSDTPAKNRVFATCSYDMAPSSPTISWEYRQLLVPDGLHDAHVRVLK